MGDAAHAARRSEHNPDHRGVVHAKDIAVAGINVTDVMKRLIGDPRVWYVIFNGFIWSVKNDWKPEVYRGDPHHEHIHVSLLVPYAAYGTAKRVKKAETSVAGWGLAYLSHPKVFVAVVGRGFLKKYNRKGL
jgi:hypothetical protein